MKQAAMLLRGILVTWLCGACIEPKKYCDAAVVCDPADGGARVYDSNVNPAADSDSDEGPAADVSGNSDGEPPQTASGELPGVSPMPQPSSPASVVPSAPVDESAPNQSDSGVGVTRIESDAAIERDDEPATFEGGVDDNRVDDSGVNDTWPGGPDASNTDTSEQSDTDTSAATDPTDDSLLPDDPCAANGGCDELTTCTPDGEGRACGSCPSGYTGDGESGCVPTLVGLTISPGALSPEFSGNELDYSARIASFVEEVTITGSVPQGATLVINGEDLGAGASWQSSALDFGETVLQIDVLREGEVARTYALTVTRAGIEYLKSPEPELTGAFGHRVALSGDGNTLAVGAPYEGVDGAPDVGVVHIFTRDDGSWTPQTSLVASNAEVSDWFGHSVALSNDGNVLAVGAPQEGGDAVGVDGDEDNNDALGAGAVYVFRRASGAWTQDNYLKASNTGAGDQFGGFVALSADGTTLAIGAPRESSEAIRTGGDEANDDANASGAVYVLTSSGDGWSQQAYVKASNTSEGDGFGVVALSADGNVLAVGAPNEDSSASGINGDQYNEEVPNSGAVYVLRRAFGSWTQEAYIKTLQPSEFATFGGSVALSGDGATLASGAQAEAQSAGAAYVFEYSEGAWVHRVRLVGSGIEGNDLFGCSVGLSGDGRVVAVGAYNEDGTSVGVGGNSNTKGLQASGAVFIFEHESGSWTESAYVKASNPGQGDIFGWSLALSPEGNTLAIGAIYEASADGNPNDNSLKSGAVYVY